MTDARAPSSTVSFLKVSIDRIEGLGCRASACMGVLKVGYGRYSGLGTAVEAVRVRFYHPGCRISAFNSLALCM